MNVVVSVALYTDNHQLYDTLRFFDGTAIPSRHLSVVCLAAGTENIQVVELPIVDSLHPRPPFMPQAIPADLAPRLLRLHGHPFVWWIAQFVSYLFRLQPWLVADVQQMQRKLGFQHPVVGSVTAPHSAQMMRKHRSTCV